MGLYYPAKIRIKFLNYKCRYKGLCESHVFADKQGCCEQKMLFFCRCHLLNVFLNLTTF